MNAFIEFEYETNNGKLVNVLGKTDFETVKFEITDTDGNPLRKNILNTIDFKNIQDFILENSEPEIEIESDFYDRQND